MDAAATATGETVAPGFSQAGLRRLLGEARQRLVQTGTRNRLVHCARFASRGKFIDIVDERSDDIFRLLVRERRHMRFVHDAKEEETEDDGVHIQPALDDALDESRYTDLLLQTRLSEDRLQKRLLAMAREARTLEEEQGINVLYLSLGFLRWFEDESSSVERHAPLILVPASLSRNDLTSQYELTFRGDDILTNEPLKRRLEDDFGIKLPEIPDDEEWTAASYLGEVAKAVSGRTRWSVETDGMQLGFFSFAKLLMVKDLEPDAWPNGSILDHPLIRGLLAEGFAEQPDDIPEDARLDELFAPADLIQIVDADSSQTRVIESVRRGRNLVVQGPPGTGKSQTITNIIAAAVHDGKTVLFMAEKMAALNVVHDRLKKAGLSELCLELHSRQANKRQVLEELARTLAAPAAHAGGDGDAEGLRDLRDRLNAIADVMHRPLGESGLTPYRVLATLVRLEEGGFSPPSIAVEGIGSWTKDRREAALTVADRLARMVDQAGPRSRHPFRGVGNTGLLPMDMPRLKSSLVELQAQVEALSRSAGTVARTLEVQEKATQALAERLAATLDHVAGLEPSSHAFAERLAATPDLARVRAIAEAGRSLRRHLSEAGNVYSAAAYRVPVEHLRQPLAGGLTFFGRWKGSYRAASAELSSLLTGQLPAGAAERIALVDRLIEVQEAARALHAQDGLAVEMLGPLWQRVDTDFDALAAALEWLSAFDPPALSSQPPAAVRLFRYETEKLRMLASQLRQQADKFAQSARRAVDMLKLDIGEAFGAEQPDAVELEVLSQRIVDWLDGFNRLDEWTRLQEADAAMREAGCATLADAMASGSVAPDAAVDTLRHLHCVQLYRQFAAAEPWITRMTSAEKGALVEEFAQREKSRFTATARLIKGEHLGRIPRGGMGAMGIIRAETGKQRRHKPIRRLVQETGPVLQQIKPVALMSPISIAQYLPPGSMEFDLLVVDEASQVRPEDALGAIARARQIVVVGDTKQLPPTSFFDRMVSDGGTEEEDDQNEHVDPPVTGATELESVLTLCDARGLAGGMLKWHYRSRHPSLIEVSNHEFYGNDLILFPSPAADRESDGLIMRRVSGAYDRGGKRTNRIEAEAIVAAVAEHARKSAGRSLGVVTFSTAQRDLITELMEIARREDDELDIFLREGRREPTFVKNLENVQGDERDVIFVSVGYGPRIAGQRLDSMAFGPVSSEGGERRLNVLFTRARYRTEIFVSFDSGDINLDRTKSVGARILKRFLAFAETGVIDRATSLGSDPGSDFESAVAEAVRRLGFTVDYQVGSAGYRIDLAVRHPEDGGRYMLAIECDGATYHSALWARERDRQRQQVLEGLGWRFHRIWSTDWFHRRAEEVRRLEHVLRDAIQATPLHVGVADDPAPGESEEEVEIGTAELPAAEASTLPAYIMADFPITHWEDPHELAPARMVEIVAGIVDVEGPVHQEEIARRVGTLFGKQRTGSRIARTVYSALGRLKAKDRRYRVAEGFWMTEEQEAEPPLRNRSTAVASLRRAAMLPPAEIDAAILHVVRDNGLILTDDVARAAAVLFGFQRTGPEFAAAVLRSVDRLVEQGILASTENGLCVGSRAAVDTQA